MIILCSVQNFGYYGVMIWLPSYLSTRFGFALTQSAVWTTVTIAGMAVGIFMFGHIADRIGRRPAFFCLYARRGGHGGGVFPPDRSDSPPRRRRGDGLLRQRHAWRLRRADQRTVSDLGRATAQNVLFNVGRAIGGFGPVVVGAVAALYSFEFAIALLATLYVLDIVALWLLIPERRGAALS